MRFSVALLTGLALSTLAPADALTARLPSAAKPESGTIYWAKADKPMVFKNGHSVGVRDLVYSKDAAVMFRTSCLGVAVIEFSSPPHNHHGLTRQQVLMSLYASAPAPQQCNLVASLTSDPSTSATLTVIVKRSF